eukprot:12091695-Heterocapsa_arctica.AAC.1
MSSASAASHINHMCNCCSPVTGHAQAASDSEGTDNPEFDGSEKGQNSDSELELELELEEVIDEAEKEEAWDLADSASEDDAADHAVKGDGKTSGSRPKAEAQGLALAL